MIWFWLCWALGGKVLVQTEIQWPVAVEVVGDSLWVLDHPGHGLWVLDGRDGSLIRRIGREGEGPGELRFPDVFWREYGEIAIYSRATYTVSFFLKDGTFLRKHAASFQGYPMGRLGEQLVTVGGPGGEGFDPNRRLVWFWDISLQRLDPLFAPSALYRKARGALQDFLFVWGPGESFFYADPFDLEKMTWVFPLENRQVVLPIARPNLQAWDGKSRDLPEPYGVNSAWSHDRYHATRPGFYFEFEGVPFLVVTWIRGTGIGDAHFLCQVWELESRVPVQFYEAEAFPAGMTARGTILFLGESEDGYFLSERPVRAFLEGSGIP